MILAGNRTLGSGKRVSEHIHALLARKGLTLISKAKADVRAATHRTQNAGMETVMSTSSEALRNSIYVAREKGSSSWLTCRPLRLSVWL